MKQILPYLTSILLTVLVFFQYFQFNKAQKTISQLQNLERKIDNRLASSQIPVLTFNYDSVATLVAPTLSKIEDRVKRNAWAISKLSSKVSSTLEVVGSGKTDSSIVQPISEAISLLSYQIATMPRDTQECFQFRTFNYKDSTLNADIDVYMDNDEGYLAMDYKASLGNVDILSYYPKKRYFRFTQPKPHYAIALSNPAVKVQNITDEIRLPRLRFVMGLGVTPGYTYIDGQFRYGTTFGWFMGIPILKYYTR